MIAFELLSVVITFDQWKTPIEYLINPRSKFASCVQLCLFPVFASDTQQKLKSKVKLIRKNGRRTDVRTN